MESKIYNSLFTAAQSALANSHSPYSGFKVASAVLMDDGKVYSGCNVENASYGATVCAERVAIWKGVSEGAKKVLALIVLTDTDSPWPPCGMCRQVIVEFASPDIPLTIANLKGQKKDYLLKDLCPSFFGPENLTS